MSMPARWLYVAGGGPAFLLGVLALKVWHGWDPAGSPGVLYWWLCLSSAALFNSILWCWAAGRFRSRFGARPPQGRSWHLFLSWAYVFICGFRSVVPRADVQRICLFDSWISSIAVGRTVATIAELCFVAQWALLLNEYSRAANLRYGVLASRCLVPLIFVAELASWYATLTTSYLGNAIEESLWAFAAILLTIGTMLLWRRAQGSARKFVAIIVGFGIAYVAFMVFVDVPMYVTRWLADEAAARSYLSLHQGWADAVGRWVVTYRWEEWRSEIPWMTSYFTLAVWASIGCALAPRYQGPDASRIDCRGLGVSRES